ncbi:MAG: ABC transporter substrate-binding protein [Desulfobacterium sp.]|nr:ABC transporter substrate-binding protein [Desulfobacterium sp.]
MSFQPKQFLLACLISIVMLSNGWSEETKPITNKGNKWRIGYLEGGGYINYPINLRALVTALAELGWLEPVQIPVNFEDNDTKELWAWLCVNVKSDYLHFNANAYWSGKWDDTLRKKIRQQVITRLKNKKEIDLMLAMGTKAGQDLATNDHSVPTIVMSSSNPLRSGIIKRNDDSGFDHVNARVDPTRYERQLQIFHSVFGFKNLGIVYEYDTKDGRTYAAIDDVEKVAKELNFNIVSCNAPFSNITRKNAQKAVLKCHQEIAPKIDAYYFTNHRGISLEQMPQLLKPFYDRKIPTFSQVGSREVRHGVLMSIARANFKYIAMFHAKTIAKIFNGSKPRDLEQFFEDPPRIAINLKAAQIIGYNPSIDILSAADEIYDTIDKAE